MFSITSINNNYYYTCIINIPYSSWHKDCTRRGQIMEQMGGHAIFVNILRIIVWYENSDGEENYCFNIIACECN